MSILHRYTVPAQTLRCTLAGVVLSLTAACVEEGPAPETTPENASIDAGFSDALPRDHAGASALAAPTVALAEFRGTVHEDGSFDIEMLPFEEWQTPPSVGELRASQQALWCPIRTSRGAAGTLVLTTDADSIGFSPVECGLPNKFPYTTLGTYCADVTISSRVAHTLGSVQAELTSITPSVGYNGYTYAAFEGLIGTDPTIFAGQTGAPLGVLGLFGYGDMQQGDEAVAQWVFENAGGSFNFDGRVMATVQELRNGFDDDCDGEVDEGDFADGETCTDAAECAGGTCDAGFCTSGCASNTWGPDCTPCDCDDGIFCNGVEVCDAVLGCQPALDPQFGDDGNPCTLDVCDEVSNTPMTTPFAMTIYAAAALSSDGSVRTWGESSSGGDSSAVASEISSGVVEVFANVSAFAALKYDGSVVTWGSDIDGADSPAVAAALSSGVVDILWTQSAFAALKDDGSVVTWGDPDQGGDSSSVAAALTSGVVHVFATEFAFAALKDDGSVVTWGAPIYGGDSSSVAAQLTGGVVDVVRSLRAFTAIKSDGSAVVWGRADSGGDASSVAADLTSDVVEVFGAGLAFAALKADGSLVTWGWPDYGGDSSSVASQLESGVVDVFPSVGAFVAVKSDGSLVSWGFMFNLMGFSAAAAELHSTPFDLYTNDYAYAALRPDGSVVTWGATTLGGDSSAVASELSGGVVDIFASEYVFAALKDDGSLVTWGSSFDGGDSSAVAAALSSGVVAAAGSEGSFAALRADGSIVTWGDSYYGGDSSAVASELSGGHYSCSAD